MATVVENMDIFEYFNFKIEISGLKKSLEIEIVHSDLGTCCIFNICLMFFFLFFLCVLFNI